MPRSHQGKQEPLLGVLACSPQDIPEPHSFSQGGRVISAFGINKYRNQLQKAQCVPALWCRLTQQEETGKALQDGKASGRVREPGWDSEEGTARMG